MKKTIVISIIIVIAITIGAVYSMLHSNSLENNNVANPLPKQSTPVLQNHVINLNESVGVKGGSQ